MGWPVQVPEAAAARWDAASVSQRAAASGLAGRILFTLTGQVFGVRQVTVRPHCDPQLAGTTYSGLGPAAGAARVALPAPVYAVDEVLVDGQVVDPAAWRVERWRWLRRIDGEPWPPSDEPGAFTVRYQRGVPVPDDGAAAAGHLAVELLTSMTGGTCALPPRVTTASRQGTSIEIADIREWFTGGLTGVEHVDLWIMAINPYRSKGAARIVSPDRR